MNEQDPHVRVRELQQRLDDAGLLWFVAWTGQHGESHFTASHRGSNRVVIHRDPRTLIALVHEADARIPKTAVQVESGLQASVPNQK